MVCNNLNLRRNMAVQTFIQNINYVPGFPVSKETSENVFSRLGDENWWKQIYDGKYHHLGPKVFDEGLHGKVVEPGFYENARQAFLLAKAHLNKKVNVEFYCELHKKACAHFKGSANQTEIKANEAGNFRSIENKGVKCVCKISEMMDVFDRARLASDERRKNVINDYVIVKRSYGDRAVEVCGDNKTLVDRDTWVRQFIITSEEAKEIESLLQNKINATQATLAALSQHPTLKNAAPITVFEECGDFYVSYKEPKFHDFSFEVVITYLFETFNRSLAEIDEQLINSALDQKDALVYKKLVLIADLYQKLEWFHPFPDGQGRTDLILLSKLLAENGFTPAILDHPYMSSFCSLEDWTAYLIEGMQKWQKEACGHHSESNRQ